MSSKPKPDWSLVDLSLVVPMHNEEDALDPFFERIEACLQQLKVSYEIICVDDGSSDSTLERLDQHRRRNRRIRIVGLSRNFGKEQAVTAGLDYSSGAAVVPIDADLQDPPEVIGEMLKLWREGYDIVSGRRASREFDTPLKRLTAQFFYKIFNKISTRPIPEDTGDFQLMDRRVVENLRLLPERNRFVKGLFSWVGFRKTEVLYQREARSAGTTKWSFWKLWNFALDGITAFSTMPLRIWTYVGLGVAGISFIAAFALLFMSVFFSFNVPGLAAILVVVLILGGLQLTALGVIGEYLGRTYLEVKQRPLYLVRTALGFGSKDEEPKPGATRPPISSS